MNQADIIALVRNQAKLLGVDADLAEAIARVESGGNALAVRFEKFYPYLQDPQTYAGLNSITQATEQVLQSMSWGPMQLMGANFRERGYIGPLVALTDPMPATTYALKHLKALCERFENEDSVIAAYNAGSPRKLPGGEYSNQAYVTKVRDIVNSLRRSQPSG